MKKPFEIGNRSAMKREIGKLKEATQDYSEIIHIYRALEMKYIITVFVLLLAASTIPLTVAQPDYVPYPTQLSWSPDAAYVAISGYGFLQVSDVNTGAVLIDLQDDKRDFRSHDWSADSKRLAVADGLGLRIWDVRDGALLFETATNTREFGIVSVVEWSSAGTTLLTLHQFPQAVILVWDAQTYEIIDTVQFGYADQMMLNPDGEHVALSYGGFGVSIYHLETPNDPIFRIEDDYPTSAYAWSGDGSHIALGYRDGRIVIWDVATQQKVRTLQTNTAASFLDLVWDPDNERIATVRNGFRVQIWNIETGELLYESEPYSSSSIDFSPDGGQLAGSGLTLSIERASTEDKAIFEDDARMWQLFPTSDDEDADHD